MIVSWCNVEFDQYWAGPELLIKALSLVPEFYPVSKAYKVRRNSADSHWWLSLIMTMEDRCNERRNLDCCWLFTPDLIMKDKQLTGSSTYYCVSMKIDR